LRLARKKEKIMKKEFNLVIVGVGGTRANYFIEDFGRGSHILKIKISKDRNFMDYPKEEVLSKSILEWEKKIFSPLVSQGDADLILALEMQEALRSLY
jgi:hypothetical protein